MGQHQTNKTALDAKAGLIPPKPRPLSKAERDAIMRQKINEYLASKGLSPEVILQENCT